MIDNGCKHLISNKREWNNCFIKFNELSKIYETWELHPDFHSVPFQFYKTSKSRHGLQQMKSQLNENFNAKQAALLNKVYNYLSFKENLSNEENATTLDKIWNKCYTYANF